MDGIKGKKFEIPDTMTGDPFVDAGNLALQTLIKRFPDKDVFDLIRFVTNIYVDAWNGKINPLFLNSKITNPAYQGEAKKTETLKLFENYWAENKKIASLRNCRICGQKGRVFITGRDSLCLSGSGKFVNFHHSHELGIQLCECCLTKLFFLPMIVIYLGKNLTIIDCNSDRIKKFWVSKTLITNLDKIGRGISDGILKYKYSNPVNAIFNMASEMITDSPYRNQEESLLLYHFTNFGASPDCNIYSIPNPVFKYMNYVINHCGKDWYVFINRYFKIKKSEWDNKNQYWIKSGKNPEKIENNDYLNNPNIVFEKLIAQKSILPLLCRFFKEISSSEHKQNFNILLADRYVMEVLKMKKEQVGLIKKIADAVYELTNDGKDLKKYLTMFEGASKAYQLRHVLLKVIKQNYLKGNKEPICRLDEYVNYLFPDGHYWGEVRDMLLIYLYEKMHDEKIKIEMEGNEPEITEEENITLESI